MSTLKIFILLLASVSLTVGENMDSSIKEIEKKIEYVRKELRELSKERETLRSDYKRDAVEFEKYRKMILAKKRDLTAEIDSVNSSVTNETVKKEKRAGNYNGLKAREANIKAAQKQLNNELLTNIASVMKLENDIPPLAKDKVISSFEILKKEIESEGVDNIEALNRYFTILDNLDNVSSTVEVTQGNSNVPFIRGMVYRIRVGSVYEAVVNVEGSKSGIWKGYDENGTPKWEEITDAATSFAVLEAIQIRDGKAVPKVATLPFMGYAITKEEVQ